MFSRVKVQCPFWTILFVVFITVALQNDSAFGASFALPTPRFDPYHHEVVLGPHENFTLEWRVDWKTRTVSFNISAECKGYIGLGLSRNGEIDGADFVIGGVDSSGRPYISDMHGLEDGTLERDFKEDWALIGADRSGGRTSLNFSRVFETCDNEEDIPMNDDLLHLIWIYGDTDEVTLFSPHLGRHSVYLLDPDNSEKLALHYYRQLGPHSNLYLMQLWRVSTRQRLLPQSSFQICSIVKGRSLTMRHFMLGGGAYIPHEAKDHVRQITLSRCIPPVGITNASTYFEPLTAQGGEECNNQNSAVTLPRQLCNEKIFVWSQGGRPYYFPEEVGIPVGDNREEYFMLEIQYSNPEGRTDLEVKAGFDLMIHPGPRLYEASILTIGYSADGQFVIPPGSSNFNIYGHCSSQCTKTTIPNDGIAVFAAITQMRSLGISTKIRQFRTGNELEWILKDNNFNSTFQQVRSLRHPSEILPGDQLTVECTFDSYGRLNGTYSGTGEDNEQCVAHLFVNQPLPASWCSSSYSRDLILSRLGIQNFTRSITNSRGAITQDSNSFASSIERNTHWTPDVQASLQTEMAFGSQISSCPLKEGFAQSSQRNAGLTRRGGRNRPSQVLTSGVGVAVTFPDILSEYTLPDACQVEKLSGKVFDSLNDNPPRRISGISRNLSPTPVLGPISDQQFEVNQYTSTTIGPRFGLNRFTRIRG